MDIGLGIGMAIMFLVTNLFIVLIMRITLMSNFDYKAGMYLGVHIPAEHKEDAEVAALMDKTKKKFRIFNNVNTFLSAAICGVCIVDMLVFVFVYIVWIIVYAGGTELIIVMGHRKMYDIKLKNGWLIESQKKVYVDTRLSSQGENNQVSMKYHWILIGLIALMYIPIVLIKRSDIQYSIVSTYFIISLVISIILYLFNIYANSRERIVYSENSSVNMAMNLTCKKYISGGFLMMSVFNVLSFGYIVAEYLMHGVLYGGDFIVYSVIDVIGSFALIGFILVGRKKSSKILTGDDRPLYVDDDEYWKSGFYYNPNDKRILVKNRLCDTNYAFNYASKGGKIIVASLTIFVIASVIFAAAALIPFMNVDIKVSKTDDTVMINGAGYKCNINVNDIEEVKLFDELPKDNFTRTNGGSTNEYDIGYYKGRTYGKCMLFVWEGYTPVLMIKSSDKIVFVNSKEEGVIRQLYNELCH